MKRSLSAFLPKTALLQRLKLSDKEQAELVRSINEQSIVEFLSDFIQEIEEIMSIDPNLERKKILEIAAERIVHYLNAEAASIRLFDPETFNMTTFGAYRFSDEERLDFVPFKDSIAGRVVQENRSMPVSSILKDPLYKNKAVIEKKGVHSLLAVPIRIPKFMDSGDDLLGSLQIYYREDDRRFSPLEIILAEVLARRVSYVLAKKKIIDLQKLNLRKENIVNKIFLKLSKREGIKLKDLFNLLLPELDEFLQIKSCSLFSVSKDQRFIRLEASYPLDKSYHKIGYTFTVRNHPYFQTLIHGGKHYGDNPFERINPSYLLIKDPRQSNLTSPGMRKFVEQYQIHSILLVPLRDDGHILYLMMFYATDQRQDFTDEEIELLTFFGREIMKTSRMELLDDVLHDIKNPAIAIAGFASKARDLVKLKDIEKVHDKLITYLDIVFREASRLQDLAFAMTVEGREEFLDLSQVARKRFMINQEAIIRSGRLNVQVMPPQLEPNLVIYCPLFGLERILDNILDNAAKAIPEQGGVLAMRSFCENHMACLEVKNSGEIPKDQIKQIRSGDVKGRGLNIIYRFIQANHGKIDIRNESGYTLFTVKLPLHSQEESKG